MTAGRESLEPAVERLGTFDLIRPAGRGAVGELWESRDTAADRQLFVQVLPEHLAGKPRACDLLREAAYAARVSNPHVLSAEFVGQTGRRVYVATPFVAGVSLAERLAQPPAIERDEAVRIIAQCLEGLSAAHAAGIIHGNLQPTSIRLEAATGRALVADFRLAAALAPVTKQPGLPPESYNVDYLSPEQARGEAGGVQSDLYALGVILFQMLAGRLPFQAETRASMAFQHMYEPSPGLSRFVPGLPGALSGMVEKLLAKDLGERYQTTTQIQADLNASLRGVPLPSMHHTDEAVSEASRKSSAGEPQIESLSQVRSLLSTTQATVSELQRERDELSARLHKVDEHELVAERRRGDSTASRVGAWALASGLVLLGVYLIWSAWGESKLVPDFKGAAQILARINKDSARQPLPGRFGMANSTRNIIPWEPGRTGGTSATPLDESQAPRIVNSLGMPLAFLPAASYYMGSHESPEQVLIDLGLEPSDIDDEYPQHLVQFARGFYIGQYEVTQEEFERIMGLNPSAFSRQGQFAQRVDGIDTRRWPVENVSWDDAVEFCRRLGELPDERRAGRTYRLPTEAEWEYACRGPAENQPTRYPFGNSSSALAQHGNFPTARHGCPNPVGELAGNPFDLYDMLGNVGEWCADVYNRRSYFQENWQNTSGGDDSRKGPHVVRRGPRCSQRAYGGQSPDPWIGFRVVCTTNPAIKPPASPITPPSLANRSLNTALNSVGMRFVRLPPGRFAHDSSQSCRMLDEGSPGVSAAPERERCHPLEVLMASPYYLGQHEVTRAQFRQVMNTGDPVTAEKERYTDGSLPVDSVSWYDAHEFCRKLSALPAEQAAGRWYRLPTELEWEYAAREIPGTPPGKPPREQVRENSKGKLRPVGTLPANAWGLHDLLGNAAEWVEDRATNNVSPASNSNSLLAPWSRVIRGESRGEPASPGIERMGARAGRPSAGFRVVLETQEQARPWTGSAHLAELQPATHHGSEIHVAIFSQDQRLALSAGDDCLVRVWDFEAEREVAPFAKLNSVIRSLAISSNGRYLATGSDDGEVNLWSFSRRTVIRTFRGHQGRVYALAFDPNGDQKLFSAGEDRTIRAWNVEKGDDPIDQLAGRDPQVLSIELMWDATRLLAGGSQGGVMAWSFPYAQELPRLPVGRLPVFSLQDLGDNRHLLTSGPLSQCVWNLQSGTPAVSRSPAGPPFRILRASGGEPLRLAGGDEQGRLELFAMQWTSTTDASGNEERRAVIGPRLATEPLAHQGPVRSLQFSLDGRRILTAGADGRVRLWSVQTLHQSPAPAEQTSSREFRQVAVAVSGHLVLTHGGDGRLRLWKSSDCQQVRELANVGPSISAVAISPDGHLAAAAIDDHAIKIWDTETGKLLRELRGHTSTPLRLVFGSNGRRLVSAAADATVRIWDLEHPGAPRVCQGHSGPVYFVDYLSGDQRIVSAGEDGTVRFWDPSDGRELQQRAIPVTGRPALAVSPAGNVAYLARATPQGSGSVLVWNLELGSEIGRLPVRSTDVSSLHLAYNGRFLISAESGDNSTVWDLHHPDQPFCELAVPRSTAAALAFTSTTGYALLAGHDGVLRSWDLPVYRILQNRAN